MNKVTGVLDGELYDANYCPNIIAQRNNAKKIFYEYNRTHPDAKEERQQLLRKLLGSAGENFYFEPPFYCDYGQNIEIGERFYSNHNLVILDCAKVTIGHDVFIAPNVGIHTAGHPLDVGRRSKGLEFALPITIGNNVWIGAGVNILPGVVIGDNAVIGAGSVVTRDVPADVIAAGNPCRVLRYITAEDGERLYFGS